MNFDSLLDKLPPDELARLQAKIANLLTSDTKKTESAPTDELEALYEGLSRTVTLRGGRGIYWNIFKGGKDYASFEKKSLWLSKYIHKYFKPKTRTEFLYTCCITAKILGDWLEHIKVPVSYRSLVNNLDRIPGLVEESFPGYGSANLLPTVIASAIKSKR